MTARWARFELLTGALAVLAWLVGILIVEGSGDTGDDSAAALLAYFENDEMSLYVGGSIFFIGSALLIWFAGTLRSVIAATGLDRLASIAFGSAVALAVTSMALIAPQIGAAFGANESDAPLTAEAAQALWFAGDGFFVASEFAAASLLAAVALAVLRSRMLPTWFAWLSLAIALVLIIPPIGWAALIFGLPIWILLVTYFLWRRTETTPALPSAEPEAQVR